MIKTQNTKKYDLEERTLEFAREVNSSTKERKKEKLIDETYQLMKIFGAILEKAK